MTGCGGADGEKALRDARARTLSAPYLVVSHPSGRELYFSRRLTVIKRRGRVLAWTTATEEFTLRVKRPCYERYTDFNRDDARQQRAAVLPPKVGNVDLDERDGMRVLSGREEHMDFADTEFEAYLDSSDRIASVRVRSAEFGEVPAGRWQTMRFRYRSAAQFARLVGSSPRPRCG